MTILILGGEGMLGHKTAQTLTTAGMDVACTIRGDAADTKARFPLLAQTELVSGVDLMDLDGLETLLSARRPTHIINCAGIIKQRATAHDAIQSITINALLPHRLAAACQGWGGRVVHFSTDCVFSGKDGHYTEDSFPDANDLYGRSKYLGEVAAENALTLRTSIIGRELKTHASLLDWFLSNRGGKIRGFSKVIYAGVTTNYLADVVRDLIRRGDPLSGLYQLAAPAISKHDLLARINTAYAAEVEIEPEEQTVSDRSLIADRFFAATNWPRPTWDALIRQLAEDPTPYEEWR